MNPQQGKNMTTRTAQTNRPKLVERVREMGILTIVVAFAIIFGAFVPSFWSFQNIVSGIGLAAAINTVVAVGMSFVIIGGGIDLSVGSIVALCGVIAADLMVKGLTFPLAMIVALLVGALAGGLNGVLVARLKLAPFIVTLGTMSFYRGLALTYTNGQPILNIPDNFKAVVGGSIGPIPIPLILALVIVGVGSFLLTRTRTGEYILALGGNEEAVRLSGINVERYKILTYVISGLASAIAALLLSAQLGAAEPIAGSGWELTAIAAAVVGGVSLSGGSGSIVGALLGAVLLGMLQNALTLLNVQAFYQLLATGVIIIGAMIIDRYTRRE